MNAVQIRPGVREDLGHLLDIYNHYVGNSDAKSDARPITMTEREHWLSTYTLTGRHQLLVAADGDRVLGYATSSPYRTHPAFAHTVETSIYVRLIRLGMALAASYTTTCSLGWPPQTSTQWWPSRSSQ